MKRFGNAILMLGLCLGMVFALSTTVRAEDPGAYYIADCDGSGSVGGGDYDCLSGLLMGIPADYSLVKPTTGEGQDLDGSCSVGGPDLDTISGYLMGIWSEPAGHPEFLQAETTTLTVVAGDSVSLRVQAIDSTGPTNRSAWGVVYSLVSGPGLCDGASIRSVDGSVLEASGPGASVFAYTMDGCIVGGNAWSQIQVLAGSCLNGDTIQIDIKVPDDIEAGGIALERLDHDVLGAGFITVVVSGGTVATCDLASVDVSPVAALPGGTVNLAEGNTQQFTTSCTYVGAGCGTLSDDCTQAGGVGWTVLGNLTDLSNGLVQANQDPCGGEPADGQVQAAATYGAGSFSDSTNVNVTNDDTRTATVASISDINEQQTLAYTARGVFSDGCSVDVTATSTVGNDCTGGAGSITGNNVACGVEPAGSCSITESALSDAVTLHNNDSRSGMTCSVTDVNESQTLPYTCNALYGADVCESVTATSTISGACTGGAGSITGNNVACGVEPAGACSINEGTDSSAVTLHNDDVRTGLSCTLATATEGVTGTYTCAAVYGADNCEDVTATSNLAGTVCSGSAGNYACLEVCGNDNPADSTLSEGVDSLPVSVIDDGDAISATTALPAALTEGTSASVACQYVWGAEGTCNDADDICTADLVGGGPCTLAGSTLSLAEACGNDNPADCTLDSAKTPASPDQAVVTSDDGDAINGTDLAASQNATEGVAVSVACSYTWTEGGTCNDADDICTNDLTVSGPCAKVGANVTPAEDCGNDDPADCSVDTAKSAASPDQSIPVADDGDVVTAVDETPNGPMNKSTSSVTDFSCVATWNEGCTTSEAAPGGVAVAYSLPVNASGATIDAGTGVYTAGTTAPAADVPTCTVTSMSDGETVNVTGATCAIVEPGIPGGPGSATPAPTAQDAGDTSADNVITEIDAISEAGGDICVAAQANGDGQWHMENNQITWMDSFDTSAIPGGATINTVSIRSVVRWNSGTMVNPQVQFSTDEAAFTPSGTNLIVSTAAWQDQTYAITGSFTPANLATLDLRFTNTSGANNEVCFDYLGLVVTYTLPGSPDVPITVLIEGENKNYEALITWGDGSTEPANLVPQSGCTVTDGAGGTGTMTASQVLGPNGGNCIVRCDGEVSAAPDGTNTIPVTNDDTLATVDVQPNFATIPEGGSQGFTALASWTDGYTLQVACDAGTVWNLTGDLTLGSCAANVQAVNANQILCGAGGSGTVNATYSAVSDAAASTVTVSNDDTLTSLTQSLTDINEGQALAYTALAAYNDGCTVDVTPTSTVGGNCTGGAGSITGSQVACGAEPAGSCTVLSGATVATPTITLHNDDVQTGMNCAIVSATEGVNGSYTCAALYGIDSCEDVTASTQMTGTVCSGNAGSYTCSEVCGNDDPADSTIVQNPGGLYPQLVPVNDDGDAISGSNLAASQNVTEGAGGSVACQYVWGAEGTCNDSNDNCTADGVVESGPCTKSGSTVTADELCGNDNPADCVIELAKTALNNDQAVVTSDDGDAISGSTLAASQAATEGVGYSIAACLYSWTESGNCNDSNDVCATDAAVESGPCTKSGNTVTPNELCGNDNPADCVVELAKTALNNDQAVVTSDDGDAITVVASCPGALSEGGGVSRVCTYTWTENGNCNDADDICTADLTVSGGTCTAAGNTVSLAETCGNDNPADCTMNSTKTAANPDCTVITSDDGDAITGSSLAASQPLTEGNGYSIDACTYTWSESGSCNDSDDSCPADAIVESGPCTLASGTVSLAETCGNDNPADCVVELAKTALNNDQAVVTSDDGDAINGSTLAASQPVTEGNCYSIDACLYSWTESGNCNDSNDICATDAIVESGPCTLAAGTVCETELCGNDNPTDCVVELAKTALNNDQAVVTSDDGDAITGTNLAAGSTLNEGASKAIAACLYTWNESGNCNDSNDICNADLTVSAPCTKAGNTLSLAEACGNDNPADCNLDSAKSPASPDQLVTTSDDGDAITGSTLAASQPATEGVGYSIAACLYSWNESGNCNDTNDVCATDAIVESGPCTKSGNTITPAEDCGNDNPLDCVVELGKTALNNDQAVVTSDDTDTVTTVNETPLGPINNTSPYPDLTDFSCVATWNEGCTTSEALPSGVAPVYTISPKGCANSSTNSGTGAYSTGAAPGADCTDVHVCTVASVSDGTTINNVAPVGGCAVAPVIGTVFPLNQPTAPANDRYRLNSHLNQGLTVLFNDTTGDGSLTASTVTCGAVTYNCTLAGYPDVNCTPAVGLAAATNYTCSLSFTNACGTVNAPSYGNFTTAANATAPTTGGTGSGYIGGNSYSRSTGVSLGQINIQVIDPDTGNWVQGGNPKGKAYLQVLQNGAFFHRFTGTNGNFNLAAGNVTPLPFDELTVGFKCGLAQCLKGPANRPSSYNDYQFLTLHDVDAQDVVVRMSLMPGASGRPGAFINKPFGENASLFPHSGRYMALVRGTISAAEMNTIATAPTSVRARPLFMPPVKLRAAFVLLALRGSSGINLDTLLLTTDDEISIALCLADETNIRMPFKFALPPNLVAPEIFRTNWVSPCSPWTTNPGRTDWKTILYTSQPSDQRIVMGLGAYVNATNFSLGSLSAGLDLFAFPIYAAWTGTKQITVPAAITTADATITVTNALREFDLREQMDGFAPTDPDAGIDRRTNLMTGPALPVDPARRDATLMFGWTRRHANATDSELGGTWGDRFVRNVAINVTGVDTGWSTGLIVFGLQLNPRINDVEFTMFQMGFMQSTGTKMGYADRRYWSTANPDSEVISRILPTQTSTWVDPNGEISFVAQERGGNANYAALVVLMRGTFTKYRSAASDKDSGSTTNPGTVISVTHMGPIGSTTYYAGGAAHNIFISDFIGMPEAVSPTPEDYRFPAPQMSATAGIDGVIPGPCNRNSELERLDTITVTNGIQTDAGSFGRRYFDFTNPTMLINTARRADWWKLTTSESGQKTNFIDKMSAKKPVTDTDGVCNATNTFTDADATSPASFISQGVMAGDILRIQKCGAAGACQAPRSYTVATVVSATQLQISGTWLAADASQGSRRYWVFRRGGNGVGELADKKGECVISQWFGGAPGGYSCVLNTFWTAQGPRVGTGNIRVHIPAVTPGFTTLSGVTGYIPNLYDGIDPTAATTPNARKLEWGLSVTVLNTGARTVGGLGGKFDWNNWNIIDADTRVSYNAQDTFFYWTQ